ncbi:MAG TPA: SpoIIE family protein phosphatase, partial [Thermodesulfovibrionales bacterium]|nr:SpoIIE family protein phosphatase [Thermodesulfovibrionales bacterium]
NTHLLPDSRAVDLEKGDILLLCSDGLTDMLNHGNIEEILRRHRSNLGETVDKLVEYANRKGGLDNISVILSEML